MRWLINWHLENIKIFSGSLGTFHWCWLDVNLICLFSLIAGYTYFEIVDISNGYYWLMDCYNFGSVVLVTRRYVGFLLWLDNLCSWHCYTHTDHIYAMHHSKRKNKILTLLLLAIVTKIHPFMSSLVQHSHLLWSCYKPILLFVLVFCHIM